jgi:hypothetical protein
LGYALDGAAEKWHLFHPAAVVLVLADSIQREQRMMPRLLHLQYSIDADGDKIDA